MKSKRGTQFHIWATQTLKNHLVKGYTINEKRLQEQQEKFKELHQTVEFLKTTLGTKNLSGNEAQGLLQIISKYTKSFVLLNQFDSNSLNADPSHKALTHEIKYKEAIEAIEQLKKKLIAEEEASDLFGRQREEAFSGILNSVVQTFGRTEKHRPLFNGTDRQHQLQYAGRCSEVCFFRYKTKLENAQAVSFATIYNPVGGII